MKTILKPSGEDSFWKDAVRDLVVVVVGILAALWLESWWQDQLDRREEKQILASLKTEFQANQEQMKDRLATWEFGRNRVADLHALMGGPVNDQTIAEFESFYSRGMSNGGNFFFDPRQGQLTSVINSGKLGLINNPALRSLIADWPALIADHDFDQKLWIQMYSGPFGQIEMQYVQSWPESRFEYTTGELMQNPMYDNALEGIFGILGLMILEGNEIVEATNAIMAMIDDELGDV